MGIIRYRVGRLASWGSIPRPPPRKFKHCSTLKSIPAFLALISAVALCRYKRNFT